MNEFEPPERPELTTREMIELCSDILSDEMKQDLIDLEANDISDVIGNLYGILLEAGVDDPDQYLKQRGILE